MTVYDVAMFDRDLAVAAGAIEVSMRQLAAMAFLKRQGLPAGYPEGAVERMIATLAARRNAR